MKQPDDWPAAWTAQIGEAVRRARGYAGLSASALSRRCAELGAPIPRNTISNLENGRKETIPVHEIFAIAAALGVSPTQLIAPLGVAARVTAIPAQGPVEPISIASNLQGWVTFRLDGDADLEPSLLNLWEVHERSIAEWCRLEDEADPEGEVDLSGVGLSDNAQAERLRWLRQAQGVCIERIVMSRREIEQRGYMQPPLRVPEIEQLVGEWSWRSSGAMMDATPGGRPSLGMRTEATGRPTDTGEADSGEHPAVDLAEMERQAEAELREKFPEADVSVNIGKGDSRRRGGGAKVISRSTSTGRFTSGEKPKVTLRSKEKADGEHPEAP